MLDKTCDETSKFACKVVHICNKVQMHSKWQAHTHIHLQIKSYEMFENCIRNVHLFNSKLNVELYIEYFGFFLGFLGLCLLFLLLVFKNKTVCHCLIQFWHKLFEIPNPSVTPQKRQYLAVLKWTELFQSAHYTNHPSESNFLYHKCLLVHKCYFKRKFFHIPVNINQKQHKIE